MCTNSLMGPHSQVSHLQRNMQLHTCSHTHNRVAFAHSRESTILVWTGLFLAGLDGALVLFQSYQLRLEHHNYAASSEYAESFSRSMHPTHGCTKGDGIYEGSLQLAEMFRLLSLQCHFSESIGSFLPCNYSVANTQKHQFSKAALLLCRTNKQEKNKSFLRGRLP